MVVVVSLGAVRNAASSYAAMHMVAGSRPVLVIAWEWHIGLALLCGCSGALEYPTTNSCWPINKSLSSLILIWWILAFFAQCMSAIGIYLHLNVWYTHTCFLCSCFTVQSLFTDLLWHSVTFGYVCYPHVGKTNSIHGMCIVTYYYCHEIHVPVRLFIAQTAIPQIKLDGTFQWMNPLLNIL